LCIKELKSALYCSNTIITFAAMSKPLILISNDDGISAPGIALLVNIMKELGDVVVVAPDSPQSGMGHAITINEPLRLVKVNLFEGVEAYQCSGTPADCVKLAIDKVVPRKPDLMVSGINHGSNSSINVLYSGTMSAAVEAGIDGIQAIGFSYCNFGFDAPMHKASNEIKTIAAQLLKNPLPMGTLLNVNIPHVDELKGIKICRQAIAKWKEDYDERTDPFNRKYYWMTANFLNLDKGQDTDEWALDNGYVAVVPVQFDLTDHHAISTLNSWDING
jgi:5'-nucleotidase